MKAPFIIFICLSLCIFSARGQDANYWFSNYGPGGFFTPGSVISNNRDSGVLFFNPALLAYSKTNSAYVSGNIYRFENINISNGAGTGADLNSPQGSNIPIMASSIISIKTNRPFTFAYALSSTPIIDYQTSQSLVGKFNVLNDNYSPGPESFMGQYSSQNVINVTTGILSAGFKVSPKLAAGFSMESQLRRQNYSENYNARAVVNTGTNISFPPIVSSDAEYQATYNHFGARLKLGFAYDLTGHHHFGLLVSSPLFGLGGTGTLITNYTVSNVGGSNVVNALTAARQEGLKVKWKIPLSVAFGYTYQFHRGQAYVAVEHFLRLKEYNVIMPQNSYFLKPDTLSIVRTSELLKFKDVRNSVTNIALGMSYDFMTTFTGYLSLRTDYNYTDRKLFRDKKGYPVNISYWNDYHLQIGANVKRRKFNLRTGLLITMGSTQNYPQPVNFSTANESNALLGDTEFTKATHLSIGLMFSYLYNF